MNENLFKIDLPKCIGEKITFKVENSPNRHGKIIGFLTYSESNNLHVIGYKVKCKNGASRGVRFEQIIEEMEKIRYGCKC